jgi:hypothetical protein
MTNPNIERVAHDPDRERRIVRARVARAARRALLALQEAEWSAVGNDDTAHKPKEIHHV